MTSASIEQELQSLRRRIRLYLLIGGLSRTVLALFLSAAFSFLLDWWIHLAGSSRLFLLITGVAWVWVTAYRHLYQPLRIPLDAVGLSLIVEQRFPQFREGLISAVELSQPETIQRGSSSPELVRAVREAAEQLAQQVAFQDVASFRKPAWFAAAAAIVFAGGSFFAVSQPILVRIWASRLVNPLSQERWPRKTRLEVVNLGPVTKLARGEDLAVQVALTRGRADRVVVDFACPSGSKGLRRLAPGPDGLFGVTFPRVTESMRLRARGGDDETSWYLVDLVDRPRVEKVTVQVRFPDYTHRDAETLPEGQGDLQGVVGTQVQVTAMSDIPLADARLALEGGHDVPMPLASAQEASGGFTLEMGMTSYRIEVVSRDGIAGLHPLTYKLRVLADHDPSIKLLEGEDQSEFTAGARVPLHYAATDDFGIREVRLCWQASRAERASNPAGSESFSALPGISPGQLRIESTYPWDLSSLQLGEGASLRFRLEAEDEDTQRGPHVGRTRDYTIQIVSKAQLEAILVQRERASLRELEQLIKQQDAAYRRVEALSHALKERQELSPPEQEAHVKAELDQRQITRDTEKLRDTVQSLVRRVENNQIPDFERREQMESMRSTLDELSQGKMLDAAQLLHEAREMSREATPDASKLNEATARQQESLQELRDLLERVGHADEFDQLIHQARSLTNQQQRIHQATRKMAVELLGRGEESLSEAERSERKSLARDQEQAADQMRELEDQLGQVAERVKKEQPEASQALMSALSQARKDQIRSEMGRVASEIQSNNLLSTLKPQQHAYESLQHLLEGLRRAKEASNRGVEQLKRDLQSSLEGLAEIDRGEEFLLKESARVDAQRRRLNQFLQDIDHLRREQQELREKSTAAGGPEAADLGRQLASHQKELQQEGSDLAARLQQLAKDLAEVSGFRSEKVKEAATEVQNASMEMKKAEDALAGHRAGEAVGAEEQADRRLGEAANRAREAQAHLEQEMGSQLPRLGDRQADFAGQAEQASAQLHRLAESESAQALQIGQRLDEASDAMAQARGHMAQAHQQLQEKNPLLAKDGQEQAVARTRQAIQRVNEALNQLSNDERAKKLTEIGAALDAMIHSQAEINHVLQEVETGKDAQGELGREGLLMLASAATRQSEVARAGSQLQVTLEKEKTPVFAWSLGRTVHRMSEAQRRFERRMIGASTREMTAQILHELQSLREQLLKQQGLASGGEGGKGAAGSSPASGRDGPLIPPLAEVKWLRDLELELYQATKAIEIERVLRPGHSLSPWKEQELVRMADQQGELARMAETLGRFFQERRNAQP
ncbi:MAG: hypothetical protein HYU36_18670 [Planctomycetes bacterium]|nr:hypothetical protein [Planctomycetota bacterium]